MKDQMRPCAGLLSVGQAWEVCLCCVRVVASGFTAVSFLGTCPSPRYERQQKMDCMQG